MADFCTASTDSDAEAGGPQEPALTPPFAQMAGEAELALLLGYEFTRPELLAEALTHRSALPTLKEGRRRMRRGAPPRNYERLEFLGDRVLGLVIADLLWRRFESEAEGHLTRRLTDLVRRSTLARVAATIGLDRHLRLSPAEAAAGAAHNPGILADVLEAVIAAIYLDGGFAAACAFIKRFWEPLIGDAAAPPPLDPKTTLQEWAQGRGLPLPEYHLVRTSGPDHARRFTVAVHVAGCDNAADATATASAKRAAETAAAAAFLEQLNGSSADADATGSASTGE